MIFANLEKKRRSIRLPEDDADALKQVGVLTVHKIPYVCIYIYNM
jgi:hypothetical protein